MIGNLEDFDLKYLKEFAPNAEASLYYGKVDTEGSTDAQTIQNVSIFLI